ncbi:MAG TPA: anthranilate synthase component I family protein [Spirochaetota bacterium]|nr:anthranilate synthase component I family protein [Spirochaetota bacterium]HPQ53368.1 anthranilate synthase component I family protein [Spirochaetota bacterium]
MIFPDLSYAAKLARRYSRIPVYRELDLTEIGLLSLLKALQRDNDVVFFESAKENRKWSRFSFIGLNPVKTVKFLPPYIIEESREGIHKMNADPFQYLKEETGRYTSPSFRRYGPFNGGLAGYFGFEIVNYAGVLRKPAAYDPSTPLFHLVQIDEFIVYDNLHDKFFAATCIYPGGDVPVNELYDNACRRLEELEDEIIGRIQETPIPYLRTRPEPLSLEFNETRDSFMDKVSRTKELIASGEAIQVVLSMRGNIPRVIDPYKFYLKLRSVNPSPYMFFMKLGKLTIAGSSPETHVRVEGDTVYLKPIAGTVPQSEDREERKRRKEMLLGDEKERAEHLMLVDLARNDLGRIARRGTVEVTRFMEPEDFSHVIHLVSLVQARISTRKNMIDVLGETFPAGTVSGAPKVRAIEIIGEMETTPRGVYAGAVGYLGYNGCMDTCIAIRTAVFDGDNRFIQAGAGIVYDSVPEKEYEEIHNKLKALSISLGFAVERDMEECNVSNGR